MVLGLSSSRLSGQTVRDTFYTSGVFICPPTITSINIESWGGGGGGGGSSDKNKGGSGGGGGGYSRVEGYEVTPGQSYSVKVGEGGAGIIGGKGIAGQNSYFGSMVCVAEGGEPGNKNGGAEGVGGFGNIEYGYDGYPNSGASGGPGGNGGGADGGAGGIGFGYLGDSPGGGGAGSDATKTGAPGGRGGDGMIIVTYTFSSCATLYWAGKNSSMPGSTLDTNFNDGANWSLSPDFYYSIGLEPGACNNIVIDLALTGANPTVTITFSKPSTTIKNLNFKVVNVSAGTADHYDGILNIADHSFNINETTSLYVENNFSGKTTQLKIECSHDNSLVVYNGNITTNAINNGGATGNAFLFPFSNSGGADNNKGKFILKGNAYLYGIGDDNSSKAATLLFDGTGTQTITNNNDNGYPVYLAFNTIIGETQSPQVILSGNNVHGFKSLNNLSIKNNAILRIESTQSLNRVVSGVPGTFTLGTNSRIILRGNNFPSGYGTAYNLDASSTAEFNSDDGVNQAIANVTYGNLELSNATGSGNSTKTASANIDIQGNMIINSYVTFDQSNYLVTRTSSGGSFTLSANSIHILTGSYPSGFSSFVNHANSTTNYNGAGDQNVSSVTYGNLILSVSGKKTAAGNIGIAGNLNIENAADFIGGNYSHTISGIWTNNSIFDAGNSTVRFTGSNNSLITGNSSTQFSNLIIDKSFNTTTVTNGEADKVFSAKNITVTKGNLVLQAHNDNYIATENVLVGGNGTITHSVSWDDYGKAFYIYGNLDVTGIFNPTVRSQVAMAGGGTKTIRTGDNPASTLSMLTFATGNYYANGQLKANQEVWAMSGTSGSFSTDGNTVIFGELLCDKGAVIVNGGILSVLQDAHIGYLSEPGQLNISEGIFAVNRHLYNSSGSAILVTNSPNIRIGGNLVNDATFQAGNSTTTFTGTTNQIVSGTQPLSFYNLESSGTNVILDKDISIQSNLIVNSGIFDIKNFTSNRTAPGGNILLKSGSELKVGGSSGGVTGSNFPSDFSGFTFEDGSTVNYSSVDNQIVFASPSYSNLTLSGTGAKSTDASLTIRGNLVLTTGATLKGGNYTHSVGGNWYNNTSADAFEYDSSTIVFNGSLAQEIGGTFGTSFSNFVMANSAGINLMKPVQVFESLTSSGTGSVLNTNDFLTIKSLQTRTAYVGNMAGNSINGKVSVERYISARKAWRFISVPTLGTQTIKEAWQEGAVNESSNPSPGFGIQVTGTSSDWAAAGFDRQSPAPSIKYYNSTTNLWVGITNTNSTPATNEKGYMVFVRGDRLSTEIYSPATQTNLRTKGELKQGTQPVINVMPDKYESIGNPYASPVDFTKISKGASIQNAFYLWDPFLAGDYGLGGYQTYSAVNDWKPLPGGTTSHPTGIPNTIIQSGEAFFVHGESSGSPTDFQMHFDENAKVEANPQTFSRNAVPDLRRRFLRASLFNNSGTLLDGNAVVYDDKFSNDVDGNDVQKLSMSGENFGVSRSGRLLVIESRGNENINDTIFYNLTGLKKQNYHFAFAPDKMDINGKLFLIDNYLHTTTEISSQDTTWYNFNVNNEALSSDEGRFFVVINNAEPKLSARFESVNAFPDRGKVVVKWSILNEKGAFQEYVIERRTADATYLPLGKVEVEPDNNGVYTFTDNDAPEGKNYYRIRGIGVDGSSMLSAVAKVEISSLAAGIEVFPNPVVNNFVQIKFSNQSEGTYHIKLYNSLGQLVKSNVSEITEGVQEVRLLLDKRPSSGVYTIIVEKGNNLIKTIKIRIQ